METVPYEACELFSGEIRAENSEALLAKMAEHAHRGVERVVLDVSSSGGAVAPAKLLYEELRSTPFELITRNVGEVQSMANLLLLAGNKRFAVASSTFLLHPLQVEHELASHDRIYLDLPALERTLMRHKESGNLEQTAKYGAQIVQVHRETRELQEIVERETSLPSTEVARLIQDGRPFDAAFAQGAGFIEAIVPPGLVPAAPLS